MTHEIDKKSFNLGYLLAVANIVHLHNEDVIAEDVLREGQISYDDFVELFPRVEADKYDRPVLARLYNEIQRKSRHD